MLPNEALMKLSETFELKNKQYGNSYKTAGDLLTQLFPDGMLIQGTRSFNRFMLLNHIVNKLKRYCNSWNNPSEDHLNDLIIYAAMLSELDGEKK